MSQPLFFLDRKFDSQQQYLMEWFDSSDFRREDLAKLGPNLSSVKRQDLPSVVAQRFLTGEITPGSVIDKLIDQPRTWGTFRVLRAGTLVQPILDPVTRLVEGPSASGWYGPVIRGDAWYYLHAESVKTLQEVQHGDDLTYVEAPFRWLVVARVTPKCLALFWDGHSVKVMDGDAAKGRSLGYWDYIPDYLDELQEAIGGTWEEPKLNKIVFETMWNKYEDRLKKEQAWNWEHIRIRAERASVVLNAHSRASKKADDEEAGEQDMRGLESLAAALAHSVKTTLHKAGRVPPESVSSAIQVGLLHTMIREWGPKSYEFRVQPRKFAGPEDRDAQTLRAHVYFGVNPGGAIGEDRLMHFKGYMGTGGAQRAVDWFLRELGM